MSLLKILNRVFLAVAVLYVGVSSLGPALAGTMPMADGHSCTMTVTQDRMCPMPVGAHLLAWQEAFRATLQRSDTRVPVLQTVMMPLLGSAIFQQVTLVQIPSRMPNGPPGIRSLFSFLVTAGTQQRQTYG